MHKILRLFTILLTTTVLVSSFLLFPSHEVSASIFVPKTQLAQALTAVDNANASFWGWIGNIFNRNFSQASNVSTPTKSNLSATTSTTSNLLFVSDSDTATNSNRAVVNNYYNQPVIERIFTSSDSTLSFVTPEMLNAEIQKINTRFNQLASVGGSQISSPSYSNLISMIGLSSKVDSLSGTSLSNITVSGVTGLTDADIPDGVTASNYLPLTGGTISGVVTIPYISVASTTATSTFAGGLSVAGSSGLTVLQNGKVGIGTTSPSQKFHLQDGTLLVDGPSTLTLTSFFTSIGSADMVYVSGKYAYVADDSGGAYGFQIIDISNLANPVLVGSYDTVGGGKDVFVSGKYAYVASASAGIYIIDISNPSNPTLAGTYNTPGSARGVRVSGKFAYVSDYGSGLHIIDISNPANPVLLVGTFISTWTVSAPNDST